MQRLRFTYARGDDGQYISHLDMARLWERALRRARLPIAYSQGFTPHARISFAAPLAVGVTADAELVDLFLVEPLAPAEARERLAAQLPPGLALTEALEVDLATPSVQSLVRGAVYVAEFGEVVPELAERTAAFLACDAVPYERRREGKVKRIDLRPFVEESGGRRSGRRVDAAAEAGQRGLRAPRRGARSPRARRAAGTPASDLPGAGAVVNDWRFGIDVDSVLADTAAAIIRHLNGEYALDLCLDDVAEYYVDKWLEDRPALAEVRTRLLYDNAFYGRLPALDGAVAGVSSLARRWPCYFITARPEEFQSVTAEWALRLGFPADIPVKCTWYKTQLATELGLTHFVEDSPTQAARLADAGLTVFLFDYAWNRQVVCGSDREGEGRILRVRSWAEVMAQLPA